MEQVEEICDHIVLMNKGGKILDGSVHEVRQQYKENIFSISFAGSAVLPPDTEIYEITGQKGSQHLFRIKEGHSPNEVLDFLIRRGIPIQSFNEVLPSLNEIFIRLVEKTPAARQFETA